MQGLSRVCAQAVNSTAFIELLLAAGRALGPIIRQFFSLGLNRVWLNAGDTAYKYASACIWSCHDFLHNLGALCGHVACKYAAYLSCCTPCKLRMLACHSLVMPVIDASAICMRWQATRAQYSHLVGVAQRTVSS